MSEGADLQMWRHSYKDRDIANACEKGGDCLLPSPPGAPYAIAHLQAICHVEIAALAQHFALQHQPLSVVAGVQKAQGAVHSKLLA